MVKMGGSGARVQMFQHQAPATLNQNNPVSGTQYEILAATKNCRLIGFFAKVTWTVQPDPLEIHIVIDGETITLSKSNPVSATWYWLEFLDSGAGAGGLGSTTEALRSHAFILEGKSIQVLAETTGGTVSNLSGRVVYAKVV